jgi:DNA-binding transcriptional MerR regulator
MQDQQPPKLSQQGRNLNKKTSVALPPIPEKIYFTIGEVSKLCLLEPYVLRYWEQEFPQLSPAKRSGNRRYYKRDEIILIRRIKNYLYDQGFTIEGARLKLNAKKNPPPTAGVASAKSLKNILSSLKSVLTELERD